MNPLNSLNIFNLLNSKIKLIFGTIIGTSLLIFGSYLYFHINNLEQTIVQQKQDISNLKELNFKLKEELKELKKSYSFQIQKIKNECSFKNKIKNIDLKNNKITKDENNLTIIETVKDIDKIDKLKKEKAKTFMIKIK